MKLHHLTTILKQHKTSVLLFALFAGISTLAACSGGSSSNTAGSAAASSANTLSGVFFDAPVQGLNYQTATMSGITDENGIFMYHDGETVTFAIGDVMLGSAPGSPMMTPIDLVPGAADETDPTVTNMCRLLQSLDADGDLGNGITINDRARAEMNGRMIDFAKSMADFNDYDVQAFFDSMYAMGGFTGGGYRQLQTPAEAQEHFRQTLMAYDMYQDTMSPGGDQNTSGMGGTNTSGLYGNFSGTAQGTGYNSMNN